MLCEVFSDNFFWDIKTARKTEIIILSMGAMGRNGAFFFIIYLFVIYRALLFQILYWAE